MKTKPGEVWLADLGLAAKTRPVLIVSREDNDPPRSLIIYVPITTKSRGSAYEVALGKLGFLREPSAINVQGLGSLPTQRLERRLGAISADMPDRVKAALRFTLEL
jgi:mRNA interferase MazF